MTCMRTCRMIGHSTQLYPTRETIDGNNYIHCQGYSVLLDGAAVLRVGESAWIQTLNDSPPAVAIISMYHVVRKSVGHTLSASTLTCCNISLADERLVEVLRSF